MAVHLRSLFSHCLRVLGFYLNVVFLLLDDTLVVKCLSNESFKLLSKDTLAVQFDIFPMDLDLRALTGR
jgi:hypothetical protein